MNIKKIQRKRQRRSVRTRAALASKSSRPRVSVFRSLNHIYAQIIDDSQQKTLVASSSMVLGLHKQSDKLDKQAMAKAVVPVVIKLLAEADSSIEGAPPRSVGPHRWGNSVSSSGEIHLSAIRVPCRAHCGSSRRTAWPDRAGGHASR